MATDLETRKSSTKSSVFLQRKFADLCARIRRVDLVAQLLGLLLVVFFYAFIVGGFDWLVGNSTALWVEATRWIGFGVFVALAGFCMVLTIRCLFRSVNPYYVAHQLERSLPDAKNSLINWLDLQDQDIPVAFHKTLGSRAEEQMNEADAEQTVRKRKNWVLLGMLSLPTLGLLLLFFLGPAALLTSLLRGFYPFYTPAMVTRTQITLLQPDAGDAEVSPTQPIAFAARIEGRFPTGIRPDAPMLRYRYQKDEDFRTLPLQPGADGSWNAELPAREVRTGFTYRITAGDAETPEHQIRVRGPVHVRKYEINYLHRPYRKLPNRTAVFPNRDFAKPLIHAPRGSEVEMIVRASQPVKRASVEIVVKEEKQTLPIRMLPDDPQAFACKWTLEQAGQFRVVFITTAGEENADRDWRPIQVPEDELPQVVLTQPGKDVSVPENGTLELAAFATSEIGVKSLTLHLRVLNDATKPILAPKAYRPQHSLKFDDDTYPGEVSYLDYLAFDELKDDKGVTRGLAAGTVIEYWLEATDCTDTPNPTGRVGKSSTYKVTLTAADKTPQRAAKRKQAIERNQQHAKKQDSVHAKKNDDRKKDQGGAAGQSDAQKDHDAAKKEKDDIENKLNQGQKEQDKQKQAGGAKSAEQPNPEKKDGPQPGDGAEPQAKKQPSMPPDNAGADKGPGEGDAGQPKDSGAKEKAKDGPPQGNAKGIEQNGPDVPNKDHQTAMNPSQPHAKSKGGMADQAGAAKAEPKQEDGQGAGNARSDGPKTGKSQPTPGDVAKLVEQLADRDGKADDAAKALAEIGKSSSDPRLRDLAPEILKKNGRDPKTGKEEKKGPNTFGSGGATKGITDTAKAAAVNREFAAKLGQMQLDDWNKRLSPDLLKKAGLSEADWQRYVKAMQSFDALVRRLNAQQIRAAEKQALLGKGGTFPSGGPNLVESKGRNTPLEAGGALPPPEVFDAQERHSKRTSKP